MREAKFRIVADMLTDARADLLAFSSFPVSEGSMNKLYETNGPPALAEQNTRRFPNSVELLHPGPL